MNIFALHYEPRVAAQMYCDKHVPKMCVELFQMLGSAVIRHGATPEQMPLTKKGTPLKGGYHNHPMTRWVGESRDNFLWACIHGDALCKEYTKRFGKDHACENGIYHLYAMSKMIPEGGMTPFPQCMPDEYKVEGNSIKAYRQYYHSKKFAKWEKGTLAPYWWGNQSFSGWIQ
tara:strand:+ start:10118 stop:10636 length:519 start_codon:yes stop_codon:yes gene_type:complete